MVNDYRLPITDYCLPITDCCLTFTENKVFVFVSGYWITANKKEDNIAVVQKNSPPPPLHFASLVPLSGGQCSRFHRTFRSLAEGNGYTRHSRLHSPPGRGSTRRGRGCNFGNSWTTSILLPSKKSFIMFFFTPMVITGVIFLPS